MARNKKPGAATQTASVRNISIKVDKELFARAHSYRYRPQVNMSLKALIVAALGEYLKKRGA